MNLPPLAAIAPIIWAKWGDTFLETLRAESLDADDGLAFRAMNSDAGIRTLLVVCLTDRAGLQIVEDELELGAPARPVDWKGYTVAELIFRTEKRGGFAHHEQRDAAGRTALVLCATRPASVRTVEKVCDLPA